MRANLDKQQRRSLRNARFPMTIMEYAPESVAELAAFFRVIKPEQVDTCWVPCLLSGITTSLEAGSKLPTAAVAEAMCAVRHQYRTMMPRLVLSEEVANAMTIANLTREPMRTGK